MNMLYKILTFTYGVNYETLMSVCSVSKQGTVCAAHSLFV